MIGRRVLLGSLAAPSLVRAQGMPTLNTMRSTARSWIWIVEDYAREAGHFERAGVRVVSNASGRGNNVPALAGSGIDVVLGDQSASLPGIAQGFRVRTILQTVNRYASHVVVKRAALERLGVDEGSPLSAKYAALKGLTLGTTGPGSATDTLLRWLGVQGGLDPSREMRLVPVQGGGPGMIAGLQQGALDGFCLSSPTSDVAILRAGCAYLFDMVRRPPPGMAPFCYIVATVGERSLSGNREALVRYATGVASALRSMAADPASFKAFALRFLELDPAVAEAAWEGNGGIFFTDPTPDPALYPATRAFVDAVLVSQKEPRLPDAMGFEAVYDTSVAAEALRRLG